MNKMTTFEYTARNNLVSNIQQHVYENTKSEADARGLFPIYKRKDNKAEF